MNRWALGTLWVLVAMGLVLGGCSQSPLAPSDPNSGTTAVAPPIAQFAPDGSVAYVGTPGDSLPPGDNQDTTATPSQPNAIRTVAKVSCDHGAVLRAGRFALKIPAGALPEDAVVGLSMPDSTLMVCDIEITPSSANHFKVPVQLYADLNNSKMEDVSTCTMYWYDPSRSSWLSLEAKSRTANCIVTTYLEHFSRYGSGKAGW